MTKTLRGLILGAWISGSPFGLVYVARQFSLLYRATFACKPDETFSCSDSLWEMFLVFGIFFWGCWFIANLEVQKPVETKERFR